MLSLLASQSRSMYPPSEILFRNPFLTTGGPSHASHSAYNRQGYDFDIPSPSSRSNSKNSFHDRRPPTPPPEMNTVAQPVQHSRHNYYGDRSAAPLKYEPSQIKYDSVSYNHEQAYRNPQPQPKQEVTSQPASRPRSPVFQQDPPAPSKGSTMNAIAPSLQIPRSVNNSQGSLSELAAQVGAHCGQIPRTMTNTYSDHLSVLV